MTRVNCKEVSCVYNQGLDNGKHECALNNITLRVSRICLDELFCEQYEGVPNEKP